MGEATQVIECRECGRLHQVDVSKVGESIECDCGKTLEVDVPAGSQGGASKGDSGGGTGGAVVGSLKRHWKALAVAAVAIVGALVLFSFMVGPDKTLATLTFNGTRPATGKKKENPEVYLAILEDNGRSDEHQNAAKMLLRIRNPIIVPRLCQMAARKELISRPIVVDLLGEKGDEMALEVLSQLLDESDQTLVFTATGAITRINSALSESILLELVRMPSRGREVLASIASVRNDLATRVLRTSLDDPSLRSQAMDEIGTSRLNGCVQALSNMARNRMILESDRLKSIDTLGRIDTPEARRALLRLTQDGRVGWKARQVLEHVMGS